MRPLGRSAGSPRSHRASRATFVVELYDDYGLFAATGFRTGTFPLTGTEAQYSTCGLCVLVHEPDAQGVTTAKFLATGGTVTLASFSGRLTGTVTNLTLQHVDIAASFVSTPHPDGCTTAIDSITFDVPIPAN